MRFFLLLTALLVCSPAPAATRLQTRNRGGGGLPPALVTLRFGSCTAVPSGTSGLTITRAGTKNYTCTSTVNSAPANNLGGSEIGANVWPGTVNKVRYSQNLPGGWVPNNVSITAPVGVTTRTGAQMYKVTAVGNSGAPYQFTTVPATNGPITFTAEVGSDDGTSKTVSVGANCNATCLKVRCWREDGGKVTLRPPSMCYTTVSGSQRVRMGLTYWIDGAAQTTVYPQLIPGMWSENLGSAALFGDAQLELTEYPTPFVPANLADGTSNVDLVSLTDSLPITSWAIAAMATPGGRSVWWQPTVRYLASRGTAGANNSASLYIDTSNHAVLDVIDGSGNHSTATSGYLSIPPGKSALISGYWSGAPGIAIDGSIVPVTLSGAGIGLQSAPSSIYLGSGDGSGTGAWGGQIAGFQTCKKGVSTCGSSLARPAVPVSYFIGCIGDSMTFGQGLAPWPTTLGTLLGSSYVTYNYGVSGETSAQMLTRWTSTYRYTARSHITFLGGINEVVFGNGVQVWPNIKTITDQAVADGVRVVLLTLLPFKGSGGWTAGNQSDLEAINANIRAYASPPAVVVVDTYTAMGGADPLYLNAAYDSGDHFHPNQAGADVIAALVAAAIVP